MSRIVVLAATLADARDAQLYSHDRIAAVVTPRSPYRARGVVATHLATTPAWDHLADETRAKALESTIPALECRHCVGEALAVLERLADHSNRPSVLTRAGQDHDRSNA
ncbi:hypothetical protein [Agrococcus jejuensis]|uniref:hypothetical protein n=1 Tax=Agrococcus jejuensis TaxID=399736 RepID=UPI0011A2D9FF|nr:hypothetical protein [Agrococcus jejuensis]